MTQRPDQIAGEAIRKRIGDFRPRVALILGSGLGPLAERIADPIALPYAAIPAFPQPSVSGHAGALHFGWLGGVAVMAMLGRVHAYEGPIDAMAVPLRAAKMLGVEILYLTSAVGSLHEEHWPGSLMTIADHINLMGENPLIGPNDDTIGPRFLGLEDAWDPELRDVQRAAAADLDQPFFEGVYCALRGPVFETPAEIRMLKGLGADAVGMSTVPECILARHCGLKVTGTSVVTNLGVGMSPIPVDHHQTLRAATAAGTRLGARIERFLERLPQSDQATG